MHISSTVHEACYVSQILISKITYLKKKRFILNLVYGFRDSYLLPLMCYWLYCFQACSEPTLDFFPMHQKHKLFHMHMFK